MNKKIAEEITELIMNNTELKSLFSGLNDIYHKYEDEGHYGTLEIRGQMSKEEHTRFLMLRLVFLDNNKEIHIPNISLLPNMRNKGLGMKIISMIYDVARKHNRHLFITDMTNSFYNKMRGKGAKRVDADTIMITDKTNLKRIAP